MFEKKNYIFIINGLWKLHCDELKIGSNSEHVTYWEGTAYKLAYL
jgi:hypothetical protein